MLSASSSSSTTHHERRRRARRNPETSSGDGGLGEVSAKRLSSLWALRGVLAWHGCEGRLCRPMTIPVPAEMIYLSSITSLQVTEDMRDVLLGGLTMTSRMLGEKESFHLNLQPAQLLSSRDLPRRSALLDMSLALAQ